MKRNTERGYVGLLALVVVVGLIGLFYYMQMRGSAGTTATSTPTKVGQSTMEQDINAMQSAKALQNISSQRAAEQNSEMQ